jgi:hypothetical protein
MKAGRAGPAKYVGRAGHHDKATAAAGAALLSRAKGTPQHQPTIIYS